jgi:hypothetical protein
MESDIKMQAGFKSSTFSPFYLSDRFIIVRNFNDEVWNFPCQTIELHKNILDIGVWKIKQLKK